MSAAAGAAGRAAPAYPFVFIVVWASAFVAVKAGLPEVSPFYFLASRFSLAALVLVLLVFALGRSFAPLGRAWPHYVVAGALTNGLYLACSYIALSTIGASTFALIGTLHPLMVAVLSIPLLGDRFRPVQWLGFALGVVGVAMVVGVEAVDPANRQGIAFGIVGVSLFVAGTLYYMRFCRQAPMLQANAVQFAASATCAWVLMALFETPRAVWSGTALLTLAHLTFVVSLGGMALLFTMLRTGVAGQVSANFYLVPGMALLLAWAFLGETVEPLAIPGFLVTCACVFLVNRRARQAGVAAGKG